MVLPDSFAGVDAVAHLAFATFSHASWETLRAINIDGTMNALNAAATAGARRFVFASSIARLRGRHPPVPGLTQRRRATGDLPTDPPLMSTCWMIASIRNGCLGVHPPETGLVKWEWHALGHINASESYVPPTNGFFDPYHINSIQQMPDGTIVASLVISARSTGSTSTLKHRLDARR